ncbi:SMC5-SMC6 complex localization factor protein 2 [Tiliqua scincoides]|uniref:SMC5-SMC6 complex localization factor protein 2 n=1 Tax=Tiliqua scincoides TaxID=71010 RepID=UPI003461A2CE
MIQYLSGRDGGGGDGHAQPGSPPASLPRRRFKPAGGRDDGRNQCITDYFKPTPKPDRIVLCSPEKRNGKAGLSVSCTEHLRKKSSPKPSRRKKILPPPNRSPIIEAFSRGVKLARMDSPDNGTCVMTKTMNPKVVVRKLFLSDSVGCSLTLRDNPCARNIERSEKNLGRTRTPLVENTRECKIEYVDPDITSLGLSKLTFTSKHDSLKKESFVSWCQKTVCSTMLQSSPVSPSVPLSLETLCREIQLKKETKMQCNQQAFGSEHKTMGPTFSDQDTRDFLRKRSSSISLESISGESSSKQATKAAFSSGLSSNKAISIRKSLTYPPEYSNSRISPGIFKCEECPEKRKRISSNIDLKNSQKPVDQRLEKHNFGSSLEKHDSECSKDRISPSCDVQLEDSNPSDSDLLPLTGYICVEENENSLFSKESKSLLSCTQGDRLLETLAMGIHKGPSHLMSDKPLAPSTAHNGISKVESEKRDTWRDTSVLVSENSSELPLSLRDCNNFLSKNNNCEIIESLHVLNESNSLGFNHETSVSNRRCLSDSEDAISDCNLDSSDDEVLLPLEEIMAQASRPSVKSPEQTIDDDDDDDDTQDTVTSPQDVLLCRPSAETEVLYMNRLEHLLKEKEEFRRVDELERQLQQVKQKAELNFSSEEPSNDGELSSEHRAFIERFSIISDAIPDQHPGENIFQIAHAGKLFSQHNLDLRNSGYDPQNPMEKYLFGSGITQQLFVILEGLLTSAYHRSPCPVPILKWMFQMMSIHSDSSVSRRILDILMKLTIKNVSTGDDQRKPWIPSVFDIAIVLINMGVPFSALFPLPQFQPAFTEDDIMSEIQKTMGKQTVGDIFGNSTSSFLLIESNICNVAKFLQLCISIYPEGYTDKEIFLLLLVLFKLSLEKELKQFPLVDLECLIIKLLENIREWDTKMSELCMAISYLSSHHHDLLWLVQFVPNWITRGRQVKRHLSLVVISKLLEHHGSIPNSHDQQMSLLCKDLVKMKPSNLLKRLLETVEHQNGLKEAALSELEPQAYYLTYVLLHMVREASNTEITNDSQRKWLLKLCSTLEKHVKCDIREDARLFYRTKVKDLVARTYSKWQQMICSTQLTQGTIHDFWDPDS